jgi:hypothetical protein
MTRSTNDDFSTHELSTTELETIVGGSHLMSGAPNSINGTLRVQNAPPPPPRIWMGAGAHLLAF